MTSSKPGSNKNGMKMALSPIIALIIIGLLVLSLAQPAVAQVPEWRTSLPDDAISSIALSSNGDKVVIGSTKGEVHLFTRNGSEVWAEEFTGNQLVKISGDGTLIFAGTQESLYSDKGSIRIFYRNGTLISKTSSGWITDLAVAGNSSQLVVGTTGGGVFTFNRDGIVNILSNDPMLEYIPISSIAISADGTTTAYSVYFTKDPRFVINRKNANKKLITVNVITSIAISSNGTDIATTEGEGSRGVISSRYATGAARWTAKTPRVNDLKISEDGSLIFAGTAEGSVFSLNRTGDVLWDFPTDGEVPALSINSQATKIVAGTTNGTLYLLDNKGACLWTYHADGVMNTAVTALEISRDGSSIIAVINNRELLYFTTPEILPVSLAQLPTGNLSMTSPEVNFSGLDPQNTSITLQKSVNSSAPLTGNSKLFTEICDIIRNLKSGGLTFDYRRGTSSWITMDPLVIFPHGNTFNNTRNLSGILSASNSNAVKSSPVPTKNSTGIVAASNNTTVKASPVPTKNSTGIVATSNNSTVKSRPAPTKNSTGIVAASNNTTVKSSPVPTKNSTGIVAASNNTTVKSSPVPTKNSTEIVTASNNMTVKSSPVPTKNSTGIVAASNNTTVKSSPMPTKNSTGIVAASNNTTVKSSPVPTKNSTGIVAASNNTTVKSSPSRSINSTQVNAAGLDMQNNTMITGHTLNFSSLQMGNSRLFIEIRAVIRNFKSGGLPFDHWGINNRWITLDPPLVLQAGNIFSLSKNSTGIVAASNNTTVKSSPAPTKNSTGIVATSNNSTVKSSPAPTKNSTGIVATSNNSTVKSSPAPTKNSTGTITPPQKNSELTHS